MGAPFDPERHEPLVERAWDAGEVERAIEEVVRDTEQAYDCARLWAPHPRDGDLPADRPPKTVYFGAAGVLFALHALAERGACEPRLDLPATAERVHRAWRRDPDVGDAPGLLFGESGVLLVRALVDPDAGLDLGLEAAVDATGTGRHDELMWGAAGGMVAALRMHRLRGHARWARAYAHLAERLWSRWHPDERTGAWLWTQDLYARRQRHLGACHGAAGNLFALLAGAELLPEERVALVRERAGELLAHTAVIDGPLANWPALAERFEGDLLVQWCHGAPGIVQAFAPLPPGQDGRVEPMLAAAGELVWQAGPLRKGPSLCHGTAGNGYALLELYRRTGQARWLERARCFAMHAVEQIRRRRERSGRAHHSLFTGDTGAAVYLADCLRAEGAFPLLDGGP